VPQFTLAADTQSGRRPSFSKAAPPPVAKALFDSLMGDAQKTFPRSQFGQFGAHMEVTLTNNGPVTFWIEI
jgi:D-tyrosyl-tRNA(Tyr) deacylase